MKAFRAILILAILGLIVAAFSGCPAKKAADDSNDPNAVHPAMNNAPAPDAAPSQLASTGVAALGPDKKVVEAEIMALDTKAKYIEIKYMRDGKEVSEKCALGADYDKCATCGMAMKVAVGSKGKYVLASGPAGVMEFVGVYDPAGANCANDPNCPQDSNCKNCAKNPDSGKDEKKGEAKKDESKSDKSKDASA